MNKKVYIVIPIYNGEKYLKKCLDSINKQSYTNIQLICVNDGSNDSTSDILNDYKVKHKNMVILEEKNLGVSSARNAALNSLDYSEDAYVTFIDADDWVDSKYISNLVDMMEDNNVEIACASFTLASEKGLYPYKQIDCPRILSNLDATKLLLMDETIQSHSCSKLFKVELWENIRFDEDLFYMEDQAVLYKVFYNSKTVFISNYEGYFYRQDNYDAATKKSITNKKIISGLKGYYSPCLYNFNEEDRLLLLRSANNALAAAYLTLIPHYNRCGEKLEEKQFMEKIKRYIRNNNLIRLYSPNNRNNKIKRKLFLLSERFYPLLFKIAKKFSN